jgi:hypothetical protein
LLYPTFGQQRKAKPMRNRRIASADFYASGYQPNPPLQRDATRASRLRAPELARWAS